VTGWLLDTNILSELRRPKPEKNVVAFVEGQALDLLYVSTVTLAEIRFGIELVGDATRRAELNDWLTHKLRPMFEQRILNVSEDVLFKWRMVEAGRKAGHIYSQPDLFIAATALHHGLISHSESLELVSRMLGVADWNTLSALLQADHRPAASPLAVDPVARERTQAARYPALPIRDFVPFPTQVFPLLISREKTKAALDQAFKGRWEVVLAIQKDARVDEPGPQDVHQIGLLAQLVEHEEREDGALRVVMEARRRVAIHRFVGETDGYQAEVGDAGEEPTGEAIELVERTLKRFERYAAANDIRMAKGWPSPEQARDPGRIADVIAMHTVMWLKERQDLLATLDPVARLQRIHALLASSALPFSSAFEATRRRALASATQRNHRYATLEHLLLALIDDADAAAVLRACNADLAALKADLLGFLGTERENLRVEPGAEARPSPAFRRAAHRAQLQAQELCRSAVTGVDVLLGLFPETLSPAARLLDKQGVSPAQAADVAAHSGDTGG
jgi:ATP-dependent Lon protease